MYLLRKFRHSYDKGTQTGELVRLAAEALRQTGHGNRELRFHGYFADDRYGKVSGIARLLDRFGDLITSGAGAPSVIATMPVRSPQELVIAKMEAFDLATAIAIADGVPRKYPLAVSHFLVTPVPALELIPADRRTMLDGHGDAAFAEVVVHSRSGSRRREVEIRSAVVAEPPAPGARRVPSLPPSVKQLLELLGKPGREQQELVRSAAEEDAVRARNAALASQVAALTEALEASWASFAFRHELIDDHRHEEHDMDLRAALAYELRADGWTQTSRGFRKLTPARHELTITYDRTPLGNHASAYLRLRGIDWEHGVSLWPRRTSKQVRIRSRDTAWRYAANITCAAAHAVASWASPIEALHEPGDGWLPR